MNETVDPETLYERVRRGERVSVLDVRNRDEFEEWHVDGPNVEVAQEPYVNFVGARVRGEVEDLWSSQGLDAPVVVVCARGETSDEVADLLREAGVEAANLGGGMARWARVYGAHEVPTEGPRTVVQYDRPSSGCLSYLVAADGEAAVVDPLRAFADRYVEDAADRDADLRWAVDTHVHADHVSGVRAVAARSGARVVLPSGAADRGLAFEARLLEDGESLPVGDAALTALHAPGHTSELQVLRVGDVALTADALFLDGVGRPDLEAGDEGARTLARRLHETLTERLAALPGDTTVAPGHVDAETTANDAGVYAAPIAAVRERVAAFGADRTAFVERVATDLPPRPANYERIVAVNLGRRDVDDEAAFDLELGPNNCAVTATR
ncbi:MAG: MBL fold metallo-hydrolase [Halobacteriaceae archaeon]